MTLRTTNDSQPADTAGGRDFVTLIGLFEDMIDARHTLSALRKDGCPREMISLIYRDRKSDEGGPAQRHGAVAQAVEEADLNGHSNWLLGLASVIVAERGTFLVAGPIGAALASVTLDDDEQALDSALTAILSDFGFNGDEITYVESRIRAGAMMVALTSDDPSMVTSARDLMAEDNAVHIGAAATDRDVALSAIDLLVAPPESYGASDVVVTDAVSPLQTLVGQKRGVAWIQSLRGARVIDPDGADSGRIENLIAEVTANDIAQVDREQIRYVVVGYGGFLGIGRRLAAVPIEHIRLTEDRARISVTREVLQQAPAYDPGAPFSRREEQVVCAYFGCTPYWADQTSPPGQPL